MLSVLLAKSWLPQSFWQIGNVSRPWGAMCLQVQGWLCMNKKYRLRRLAGCICVRWCNLKERAAASDSDMVACNSTMCRYTCDWFCKRTLECMVEIDWYEFDLPFQVIQIGDSMASYKLVCNASVYNDDDAVIIELHARQPRVMYCVNLELAMNPGNA